MTRHNPKKYSPKRWHTSEIQTLLFPKDKWSAAFARRWALHNGFKASKTDITTNYIRIRQRPPSQFSEFRTIELGDSGVKAVIGEPKSQPKRNNFGERSESPESRKQTLSTNAAQRYKSSHWWSGKNPRPEKPKVYDVGQRKGLPEKTTKMGDLLEIKIRYGPTLKFSPDSTLVFSPMIDERLYNVLTPAAKKKSKKLIRPDKPWVSLTEAAEQAGGRQSDFSYPSLQVQVLGEVKHVIYHTHKAEDGPSDYIHELGEVTGIRPLLAVDKDGRLWYAGGNYSVPDEGITD